MPKTRIIAEMAGKGVNGLVDSLGWGRTLFAGAFVVLLVLVCLKECTRVVVIRERYE